MPEATRRRQLLDRLYDARPEPGATTIQLTTITGTDLTPEDEHQWRDTARSLARDHLIQLAEKLGFDGWAAAITPAGRDTVEQWRARRDDPTARQDTAENNLLRWLADQDDDGSGWHQLYHFQTSPLAQHEGVPLTQMQIGRAAEQLRSDGLIDGDEGAAELPGPLLVRITRAGRDCIRSGATVSDYLRRPSAGTTNITTFHGPVSGTVAWASERVTQHATTTTGAVGDELRLLVQAIVAALPALNLTAEQEAAVTRDAEVIEGELQRQTPESQAIVRSMIRRTLDTIQGEANNQLAVYLVTTAKQVLTNVGLGE